MQLLFLGTSAGTPTRARNVTALAIRRAESKRWCLVDCGEGTQQQILRTPLSLNALSSICITHVHGDHCYGLPGLLGSAGINGRKELLTIYGPAPLKTWLDATVELTDIHLKFPLRFVAIDSAETEHSVFEADDFNIKVTPLSHRVPSFAYSFTETRLDTKLDIDALVRDGIQRGPIWGQISRSKKVAIDGAEIDCSRYKLPMRQSRKIVIGGDNDSPALLAQAASGAQVLVHEATYTSQVAERVGPSPQHSSARAVARFAQSAGLPNLVLTHFSARYGGTGEDGTGSLAELREEAERSYRGRLFLANDFDLFRLDHDGQLDRV